VISLNKILRPMPKCKPSIGNNDEIVEAKKKAIQSLLNSGISFHEETLKQNNVWIYQGKVCSEGKLW
jgi:hypothetical protein